MKWKGKEVKKSNKLKEDQYLTDQELIDCSFELGKIKDNYDLKISNPKYQEKFKNQPLPTPNPAFTQLLAEVNEELDKRGLII